MKSKKSVWDSLSKKYEVLWVQRYSLKPTREKVLYYLSKYLLNQPFNLLDMGCGTGQLLQSLCKKYPEGNFIGIDKSPGMIRIAEAKGIKAEFYCLDIGSDDFKAHIGSGFVDILICSHSFPYYTNKKEALIKLQTLLKPNGIAIFAQAAVNNFYDWLMLLIIEATAEKADYLSRKDFRDLVSEHFDLIDEFSVHERFYMPSICGYVLRKNL